MAPTHHFFELEDLRLSYYEWGNPSDPTILFIHATGMHARVWDKTIESLPGGYHCIAVDIRGHGGSRSADYLLDWRIMAQDISVFLVGLNLQTIIGVGHSMGGHVLTQLALLHPDRFRRLVLIDPVIFPPSRYESQTEFEKGHPTDNPIARRRNRFEDWQDMKAIFEKKQPYTLWRPEILENYCRYGVIASEDGVTVSLACAPDVEASVYMGHASVNLLEDIPDIGIPTKILRAREGDPGIGQKIDFSASPTWNKLASLFPDGQDIALNHLTHFMPMEDPELIAEHIMT